MFVCGKLGLTVRQQKGKPIMCVQEYVIANANIGHISKDTRRITAEWQINADSGLVTIVDNKDTQHRYHPVPLHIIKGALTLLDLADESPRDVDVDGVLRKLITDEYAEVNTLLPA